jgi:hypothetical protein
MQEILVGVAVEINKFGIACAGEVRERGGEG